MSTNEYSVQIYRPLSHMIIMNTFSFSGLGISELIGHVDFFPNGGSIQPGCNQGMMQFVASKPGAIFQGFRKFLNCNHVRAHEFFQDSILSPCPFMAAECTSYQVGRVNNITLLPGNQIV